MSADRRWGHAHSVTYARVKCFDSGKYPGGGQSRQTFATSGPMLTLLVGGQKWARPCGGGRLTPLGESRLQSQETIQSVELVENGESVRRESPAGSGTTIDRVLVGPPASQRLVCGASAVSRARWRLRRRTSPICRHRSQAVAFKPSGDMLRWVDRMTFCQIAADIAWRRSSKVLDVYREARRSTRTSRRRCGPERPGSCGPGPRYKIFVGWSEMTGMPI